jgi:endo-1,4-beta-xylanase
MNRIIFPLAFFLAAVTSANALAQRTQRKVSWVNAEMAKGKGLEHRVLASNSLGHDVGYVVWTPPDYDGSGKTRYPVIYFLHGAGGTEASDSAGFSSRIAKAIRNGTFPPVICVFPNGGMSGYRDGVESMIIDELIPLIDHDYATKAESAGRAIAGFSMGGSGSVRLSMLHPELFCAAGSWGGALSWRGSGEDSPLLSAAKSGAATLGANNFALLTMNGDQDHPEGFTPLYKVLKPLNISHQVVTLADTKHNLGHYYDRSADKMLAFLAERLRSGKTAATQKRTVRVLTIGNSFAGNACKYLTEIAADGGVELTIGTANLGGCTLERHASLAKQSETDATNKPYKYVVGGETRKLSLQEYLAAENWDYVTLQQMSALSFQAETFHPHIDDLVAVIRKLSPESQILIHETWAYRPDSPLLKEWGISQGEMHDGIVRAYASVAKQFDARIIPVGSAFNNVRATKGHQTVVPDPNYDFDNPVHPNRPDQTNSLVAGWYWDTKGEKPKLRLDFKHANTAGCYLAGLVWYEVLTGNDAREIRYTPQGIKDVDKEFLREVAHAVSQRVPTREPVE